eukprot:PhM_4_TR10415/c0_g1_i4/m.22440
MRRGRASQRLSLADVRHSCTLPTSAKAALGMVSVRRRICTWATSAAAILKHDVPNLFTTINGLEATETSVVLEVFYGLLMTEWKRGWKKEAPAGWGRSNASSAADGSEYGWSGGGGGGSRTPASDDPIEAQNTFVAFAPSAAAESNANTNVLAVSIRRLLPLHTFHPANHTFLTG